MTYNQCKSDFGGGQIISTTLGQFPVIALKGTETAYSFPAVLLFIKHLQVVEFNKRFKALGCVFVENPAESLANELKQLAEDADEIYIHLDQNRDLVDYRDAEGINFSLQVVKNSLIPIKMHFDLHV